jgi:D-alanine-D-alanine ligase
VTGRLAAAAALQEQRFRRLAPRTVVLTGPASPEDREYHRRSEQDSLSHHDLCAALERLGARQVDLIDISASDHWFEGLREADLAVINLHGQPGEDGSVQGLLRLTGVPFAGSEVEASVIGLNKFLAKAVAISAGIRTPDFFTLTDGVIAHRGPPPAGELICKPLRGGSSIGTFLLSGSDGFPREGEWIVEQFLPGVDVTVMVLEDSGQPIALPAVALQHRGRFYGTEGKLAPADGFKAVAHRPPQLAKALDQCQAMAETIHRQIGARHLSRCDFVVCRGEPYLLEINTVPGISRISNAAECAYAAGLTYDNFVALILGPALPAVP